MAMKMSREGRWLDIICYIHRRKLLLDEGSTIGEYCRQAGLERSPYMAKEFDHLVLERILLERDVPYKATFKREYRINYEFVAEFYPQIHEAITAIGVQGQLL